MVNNFVEVMQLVEGSRIVTRWSGLCYYAVTTLTGDI